MKRILLIAAILLSSCQRGVTVTVVPLPHQRLSIEVHEGFLGNPCVRQVQLFQVHAGERLELWRIAQPRTSSACLNRFIYPDVPAGFQMSRRQSVSFPLDVDYLIAVSGYGFDGGATFRWVEARS